MKKIMFIILGFFVWCAFTSDAQAQFPFGSVTKVTTYLDTCGTGTWDVFTINSASNKSFRIQVLNDGVQAIYAVFGTDTTVTTAKANPDSTNQSTVLGEYIKPGERLWLGVEGVTLAVFIITSLFR